ncbi:MAG: class I adenylate-forming enzyme family protein [Alphaproteobacteria bacterium]
MSAAGETTTYFAAGLARHAALRPTDPAIVTAEAIIDFATLQRAVLAEADALRNAGVRHGSRLALAMRDRPAHVAALFALQRLGAAAFLVAPDEPPMVREALLEQSGAVAALGDRADDGGWSVPFLPIGAGGDADADLPPPPDPDDVCMLRRSSGTTGGLPRLTPTTHRFELTQFEMLWGMVARGPGDRYLSLVSTVFDFGRVTVQRALYAGAAVILPPALRTVGDLTAAAGRLRATWTIATPTHLRHLLGQPGPWPLLPGVGLLTTSAILTDAERAQVMEEISPELYVLYATNEVGLLAVARPDDLRNVPETVGRPMSAIRLEVVDAKGQPVPAGSVGEIRASHPTYPRPEQPGAQGSSSRFFGEWFYPGDLGVLDAQGYLFLKGRTDDVINVGGRKIYPSEIVECLTAHPAVAEAAAIGILERRLGAVPVAAVVLRGPAPAPEAALLGHCRDRLGRDRSPGRILTFEALPKTAADKVDRAALRRQIVARLSG